MSEEELAEIIRNIDANLKVLADSLKLLVREVIKDDGPR